jgi:hypothetical protein
MQNELKGFYFKLILISKLVQSGSKALQFDDKISMNTKNQTLKRKKNETKNSLTCLKAKTFKLKIRKFGKKGKEKKERHCLT